MTQEQMIQSIYEGMQETRQSVSNLETKFELMSSEMSELKTEFADMKVEMSDIKADVSELKTDVSELKSDVSGLKNDVSDLKTQMRNVQLTLENEIRYNIRAIAEGHLDLSRKLDEALKVSHEKEMLLVRVGTLETDVRNIKTKIGIA